MWRKAVLCVVMVGVINAARGVGHAGPIPPLASIETPVDGIDLSPAERGTAVQVGPLLAPLCTPGETVRGVDVGARKLTAFSFDDGPWPGTSKRVMAKFEARGARATFFVIGRMVREYPDIARAIVDRGHAIGSHALSHSYSPSTIAAEIAPANQLITEVTGAIPVIFRSPGLTVDDRIQRALADNGMCNIFTTAILGDADLPRRSAGELCAKYAANLHPGQITLLHDGGGDHEATVDAVDCMLDVALRRGYTLLTVPELLAEGSHYSGPRPRNGVEHDPPIGGLAPPSE